MALKLIWTLNSAGADVTPSTSTIALFALLLKLCCGTCSSPDPSARNVDLSVHKVSFRWAFQLFFPFRFAQCLKNSLAYILLLLPYSITKLLNLSGYPVAFGANVFAETCAVMLGALQQVLSSNLSLRIVQGLSTFVFCITLSACWNRRLNVDPSYPLPTIQTRKLLAVLLRKGLPLNRQSWHLRRTVKIHS